MHPRGGVTFHLHEYGKDITPKKERGIIIPSLCYQLLLSCMKLEGGGVNNDEKLKPLTGVWIRAGKLSVRRANSQKTHEIKELKVVFEKLRFTKFHNHKQGLR